MSWQKNIGFSFVVYLLSLLCNQQVLAQAKDTITKSTTIDSSIQVEKTASFPDSIFRFNAKFPSPKRAGLYSALVPSLGQIYNKQYWKTGVVYVAAATVTYFLIDNHTNYKSYQKAYVDRLNNSNNLGDYPLRTLEDLKYLRDNYRRLKEYSVISGVVCYLVNILDAFTSAHLKTFDMSKDISFQILPSADLNQTAGVKLAIGF